MASQEQNKYSLVFKRTLPVDFYSHFSVNFFWT